MLYSMTGYGRSEVAIKNTSIQLEVKSVNSKNLDISVRLPLQLKVLEIPLRKSVQEKLKRGSVEIILTYQEESQTSMLKIDRALLDKYYTQIQDFSQEHQLDSTQILPALLALPEVVGTATEDWSDSDIDQILQSADQAIEKLTQYRLTEGNTLEPSLRTNIKQISDYSQELSQYETERVEAIKARLRKSAEELTGSIIVDNDRLEQEIFFYIEKIDISEEKQRLKSHLDFFLEILDKDEELKGKQLNFVNQEIGRELNTLGAKSYNSNMQTLVIKMKDELEQIKEQTLNVL